MVGPLGLKELWTTRAARICPLVQTTFRVEHALWGLNPLLYHLVTVLMHAGAAVVLWRVLARLKVPGAWLGAALWALHPVQAESAAWITELKNTQSGLFFMLTGLFFVRARLLEQAQDAKGARRNDWVAIVFGALAMASKSSTVILPLVLGLCAWWIDRGWRWRNALRLAPYFVLAALSSALSIWTQGLECAGGTEWVRSWPERIITAGKVVWFYLGNLVWPHPLIFIYPKWHIDARQATAYLPLALVLVVLLVLWLGRERWSRGPFLALAYFVIALLPVLGLANHYFLRYSFVGDHFQYLAGVGPLALAGAGIWRAVERISRGKAFVQPTLCGFLLAGLGMLTWQHAKIFRDYETLWADTLARNPSCWMVRTNWGIALLGQGKLDAALEQFQAALQSRQDYAPEHSNLGAVLHRMGKIEEAIAQFRTALRIDPHYPDAHFGLGVILEAQGKADEALTHYLAAAQARPNSADAYYNISILLGKRGDAQQAMWYAAEAVRFRPDLAEAHYNLGGKLHLLGKLTEAAAEYAIAVRLQPGYAAAHRDLAQVLCAQGKFDEGVQEFQMALQLDPGLTDTRGFLADALVELGRTNEATTVFTDALELKSAEAPTHFQYANLLLTLGQTDAATQQFQAALRYAPGDAETHRRYGLLLASSGHPEEAIEQFREAIRLQPRAETHYNLATALLLHAGQTEQAVAAYRESLRLEPDSPGVLNDLAWVLAANASDGVRNGAEAVTLAERACQLTQFRDPLLMGTLAAAYAEAGRFADAVNTAEKARDLAAAAGLKKLADRNQQLMELYRSNQPYRELQR